MADDSIVTRVYIRNVRGLGDSVMLRPAIIGSIKLRPRDRHVLHCLASISSLFRDIAHLEIVEFISEGTQQFDMGVYQKLLAESASLIRKYGKDVKVYEIITECIYESEHAPYTVENGKYVPTGNRIELSRQEIWCNQIGIPFSMDNYNVQFFDSEHTYTDNFLADKSNPLVIHLKSVDKARSYKYQEQFVEYFSRKWQGHILLLDGEYRGTRKNVVVLKEKDIRKAWAVISKCSALIGIDSFGIHASGSSGVFTYGMFGPTDPDCRLLYPRTRSCGAYLKCDIQYCWYQTCKHVPCMNARTPKWYWNDIERKGLLDGNRDYFNSEQRINAYRQELAV